MPFYNEIKIINKVKCKKSQIELLLLFIEEYSGWLQHLKNVGMTWGAAGEEVGANKEAIKTMDHLDKLKKAVLSLL